MIESNAIEAARAESLRLIGEAGIVLTPLEAARIDVTDFGLGDVRVTGVQSLTYVNTNWVCAKELVLLPRQTLPEHMHRLPGKEETFRCRWGKAYLYVPGEAAVKPRATPPRARRQTYTAWHEIVLTPGEQYTVPQGTQHWLQGGDAGAVVSEFSSAAHDELDVFTDPEIRFG
jgi:D-lyxose ketol-isomerase